MTIYLRPTITPHKTAETHQNSRRKRARITAGEGGEGDREGNREHDGRSSSTADELGSVNADVAPEAEPFVGSSPGTAVAAAAAAVAAVEALSAPNREGTRDPQKHLFSAENLSKHAWNNTNGCAYESLSDELDI